MESHLSPSLVIIAYDATKDRGVHELKRTIDEVRMRGDILHGGDRLIVLGVLHKVPNPSKCLIYCLCLTDSWAFRCFTFLLFFFFGTLV